MRCGYCGTVAEDEDAYCQNCGKSLHAWGVPMDAATPRVFATPETLPRPSLTATTSEKTPARAYLVGAIVLLSLCAIIATQWDRLSSAVGQSHSVNGSLILMEGGEASVGGCRGTGGFSNVYPGAGIVVFNEKNEPIATGSLGNGSTLGGERCSFEFTIEDVPKAKFYTIEISGRGGPTNSYAEMEAVNWNWNLTLGSG